MQISVRLFGILRDKLPPEAKGRTVLTLPEEARVSAVLESLDIKRNIQVAINKEIVEDMSMQLRDGDTVECFRPSAGG